MEFMSDEEFNRVMDDFDWDAPIKETHSEHELPDSCSKQMAEASQGPPHPVTPDCSVLRPNTSESVERIHSPEDPFGPTTFTDPTKPKVTNDTYVLPAEIYYDLKHCLFWDDRDLQWTRPPRVSTIRQIGLHQNQTEPSASSTKERLDGTRQAVLATAEETNPSNDNTSFNRLTDSNSYRTGPIGSGSSGTDLSLPGDIGPSTPNPPGTFRPLDVQSSTNCEETASEMLVHQDSEIHTDVAMSKDRPSATEQGNDNTPNAAVSEDPTNATHQDDGINTKVLASNDYTNATEQGDEITTNSTVSKDHDRFIDQDDETMTDVPALKHGVNPIQQIDEIITDGAISYDRDTTLDQGNEIITSLPASTDLAKPSGQGDKATANVHASNDCDRAVDQDGEIIANVPAPKDSADSLEHGGGINTNAAVSKDYEGTTDQGVGNGQHEATASGTAVPQDSAGMQGIEKTSTVNSTETRPMAVAPKRPLRLFSSAVSLSSIPVRGCVKTRKSVNPCTTWQPPNSGKITGIPESPTGIPHDIGKSSNIGETITTTPASATLSNPDGPPESAREARSLLASDYLTLRDSSAHSWENARSMHSQPPTNVSPRANEIGKSLEVPHEPQAISTIDASAPAEHPTKPVEAVDLTLSTSTKSASTDVETSPSEIENICEQQPLCDEEVHSTEDRPVNTEVVVDLTQIPSDSDASTPPTDSSHSPEAIHEALPSLVTKACAVEQFTKTGAVKEVDSFSDTDVGLPQKPLHDAQASVAPVSFANSNLPVDGPEAVHEANSQSGGNWAHFLNLQRTLHEAQSSSAPDAPVATELPVGPQESVRRSQSSFIQFVCMPTEEPVSSLEAAEVEEAEPSPIAEASIPVHSHASSLGASQEGQALSAPDTNLLTEKHAELLETAHERSEEFSTKSSEPTGSSGAPLEAAQEVKKDRNDPDEEVSLVETSIRPNELLESSNPQLKVLVPSPRETLTPPDSRRSSLRGKTTLKKSVQEPVRSRKEPTILMEERSITGSVDATAAKVDRTAPKTTSKSKSRARSSSTSNRSTRSNTIETSMRLNYSTLPTRTAPLSDDDGAPQVKQAKALPGGDDIPPLAKQQASGNDSRLVGPKKASQAELSSEYHDELAMSDPEDPRSIPFAVQLTPRLKHQVHTPMSSPLDKRGRCRKETQSPHTASAKATKRARTGPQGRKLVGDRELGGLLMRQDTQEPKVRRMDGETEVNGMVQKAMDKVKRSNGNTAEDAPEKKVGKAASAQTASRKRGRNKSLDLTSDRTVIEKKPRRSGRLSDGVDTTEDVELAKNNKPRRSGRLVDGAME